MTKKIVILSAILIVFCILFVLFGKYRSIAFSYFFGNRDKLSGGAQDVGIVSPFSEYPDTYLVDSDLGVVPGDTVRNSAAVEFNEWLNKRWVAVGESVGSIESKYDTFNVIEVLDGSIKAKVGGSDEIVKLTLECLPDNTALYKTVNMQFVSANFKVSSEIKTGDILYTKCVDEACESVGPKCIILRRPVR